MASGKLILNDAEFDLLKRGELNVYEKVFHFYNGKIKAFASAVMGCDTHASEISQITMIKLWENRASLKDPETLDGFVFTVAKNAISMIYRKNRYERRFQSAAAAELDGASASQDPLLGFREITSRINTIVDALPARRKEVFILSRERNLSNDEIAALLGLSKRTVEKHLSLAMESLRENLSDFLKNN